MKVAIFGQYYQNDTRPIIRDIFIFFNANNVEMVIEENFLKILYEQEIVKKEYNTFNSYKCLDSSFDVLVSIGGDGTILRAATFVRDSGVPIIGINAGRLGFLAKVQKESMEQFLQIVLQKKYTISPRTLLNLTCSPENESIKELRGNHPNLQYHYFTLLKTNKTEVFLRYFPVYTPLFNHFSKEYNRLIINVHQCYYKHYVLKNYENVVTGIYRTHIFRIHHQVFIPSKQLLNKIIITRKIVKSYFDSLQPKELLYAVNQHNC